ncbi:MBL fold metallo-hydrolase [Citrobacter sp. Igbk 14]|uniref:MBL fold metallo-hydrolase n=1 Tax=Citrobacter sp. Igbk 14 TaxID=2963960 RepID=UPI002303F990|nr:MBL fold metallo-hydrolase [Citrobacter sp. Igbk 14]MDA8514659.1 MBL fold metallo-hydrolase [Citrobacter sp. Igbk 14]
MALTLTVLLENRRARGAEKALRAKPGLSLLVQDETTTILFDTGPDDSFRHNAALMGVDLSQLTAVVLSHGHYDHCGGVPWLPDSSRVICHPRIACERYAAFTLAGYTRKIKKLSRENDYSRLQMAYSREPLPLSERFLWSGEISVSAPQAYGVINEHPPQQDYITDEGVLIYKSDRGLVIITGCGHRGIANIVAHSQRITGISKIHALVGGFHLRCASPYTLWQTRRFIKQQQPEKLLGCHCTGAWGRLWLPGQEAPATGDVIVLAE